MMIVEKFNKEWGRLGVGDGRLEDNDELDDDLDSRFSFSLATCVDGGRDRGHNFLLRSGWPVSLIRALRCCSVYLNNHQHTPSVLLFRQFDRSDRSCYRVSALSSRRRLFTRNSNWFADVPLLPPNILKPLVSRRAQPVAAASPS